MGNGGVLLQAHIFGAILFVGGSVAAGVLNVLAIRAKRPSQTARLLRLIKVPVMIVGVGAVLTLVLGLWLVHRDGYGYGAFWVWGSIVLWLAANAFGGLGGKQQRQVRVLAEELAGKDDVSTDELHRALRDPKLNAMSWLAGLATLAILVLMLWRPG